MKLPIYIRRALTVAAASLGLAATSDAAVTLTIEDFDVAPENPTAVVLDPATALSFDIKLTLHSTSESLTGISYFLQVNGAGSGWFSIASRDISDSLFDDPTTDGPDVLQIGNALLAPQNSVDLGGTLSDPDFPPGAGDWLVAKYTLTALSGITPGTYTIGTSFASYSDENFDSFDLASPGYTVVVVPEPNTAILGGLGLSGAVLAIRRRPLKSSTVA
ncbi:MAG TPA: PEP-CTERM sorting domain-containing protein [Chthoniobacterales bacterium]